MKTKEIEEKLLKGCGEEYNVNNKKIPCPYKKKICWICQAKLQQHKQTSKAKDDEWMLKVEEIKNPSGRLIRDCISEDTFKEGFEFMLHRIDKIIKGEKKWKLID